MEKINFRKFYTSSGKLVLAGRDSENNEELVKQAGKDELVLHTKAPGSPFVNIKLKAGEKIGEKDIKEAALFCAKYSQAWKKAKIKKDVAIHIFKGKDIFKARDMKTGTFGVKRFKETAAKKEDIENCEKHG